jgi:hypothetical protein
MNNTNNNANKAKNVVDTLGANVGVIGVLP